MIEKTLDATRFAKLAVDVSQARVDYNEAAKARDAALAEFQATRRRFEAAEDRLTDARRALSKYLEVEAIG